MPSDIRSAIEAQNTQVAAGAVGDLPVQSRSIFKCQSHLRFTFKVSLLEEFENIIVKF